MLEKPVIVGRCRIKGCSLFSARDYWAGLVVVVSGRLGREDMYT